MEDIKNTETSERKQTTLKVIIAGLLIVLVTFAIFLYQQEKKAEALEERAYTLSVLISLQEDTLEAQGVQLEESGLKELREAWVDNPCYETAEAYSAKLEEVLNSFGVSGLKTEI